MNKRTDDALYVSADGLSENDMNIGFLYGVRTYPPGVGGSILGPLGVAQLFVMSLRLGDNIISGLGYVRFAPLMTLLQDPANLGLTLFLVIGLRLGLQGVAWGTFYPRCVMTLAAEVVAAGWVHLSLWQFVRTTSSRWFLTAGLFLVICRCVTLLPLLGTWAPFLGRISVVTIFYLPLCWFVLLERADRVRVLTLIFHRSRRAMTYE